MTSLHDLRSPVAAGPAAAPDAPDWQLFHSNARIWPAVLAECDAARESLTIEQFIFSPDGVGRRMLDVLTAKARQGVHVRLLVDGFGSFWLKGSEGGKALRRAGGEIVHFHSLTDIMQNPIRRLQRLHRKTVIRDRRAAFIGGACYHDRMADWRDTMIRIDGRIAENAAEVFDQLWENAIRAAPPPEPRSVSPVDVPWAYLISTPIKPARRELWDRMHARIENARDEVILTTPYLVPDNSFRRAINRAAGRGVAIRIVMPARSDHPSVDVLGRRFAHALARRGARIHLYEPSMIHCKLALVDGAWASVSSFNLDLFSFWMNLESGVVGTDPVYCAAIAEQLDRDIAASTLL